MSLKEEDRRIMVELELERTEKTLREMEVQFQNELWAMVANRLYYALFHAVSALLISDRHEVGTHRGAVNRFHMFYVKEGIFTNEKDNYTQDCRRSVKMANITAQLKSARKRQ